MLRRVTRLLPAAAENIELAAGVLRRGGLVAFPTETVYGLGANALDNEAVKRIYAAKGRPQDNPLIAHVVGSDMLRSVAREVNGAASALMAAFWPGALTLVLPKAAAMPDAVTCGLDTVAVREPSNEVARALIKLAGAPIAAPSANVSGKPSPTAAAHVLRDMDGLVDIIIDGGRCAIGVESTIVNCVGAAAILRPGGISREAVEAVIGETSAAASDKPVAPGMKYRHYAPNAALTLVLGEAGSVADYIRARLIDAPNAAVTASDGLCRRLADTGAALLPLGDTAEAAAANLFDALRRCDDLGVSAIFAEGWGEGGVGAAVMNRLRKAAFETVTLGEDA